MFHDDAYASLEDAELAFDINSVIGGDGYWYLASPYSKYPSGIEEAYREVCRASGWLVRQGVKIYCPIAHTHPIAIHGDIDPYAHQIWLPLDEPLMHGAKGLIVCMMPTWRDSYGIGVEIETFQKLGKPIKYLAWNELAKEPEPKPKPEPSPKPCPCRSHDCEVDCDKEAPCPTN